MLPAEQILAHLIGDFVLQSGWMANNKQKRALPALVHALVYYVPFLFMFQPSAAATAVIVGTHFSIDRWALARYIAYAKEFLSPKSEWKQWEECNETGLPKEVPLWLAKWLLIIVDNTMHLAINALALTYL